ncbi:MAG: hypothetical protein WAO71_08880 [Gallionella sp.]
MATLHEVSNTQTRLSQVFMLNPNDHYLTFTLSGAALDNLPHPNPLPLAGEGANVKGNLNPWRGDSVARMQYGMRCAMT